MLIAECRLHTDYFDRKQSVNSFFRAILPSYFPFLPSSVDKFRIVDVVFGVYSCHILVPRNPIIKLSKQQFVVVRTCHCRNQKTKSLKLLFLRHNNNDNDRRRQTFCGFERGKLNVAKNRSESPKNNLSSAETKQAKMVSNGQSHNPMLWAPRRFPPVLSSPYFGFLPPGAPATYPTSPGAISSGKFPNPKSVLPYLGNNKEAQMFLSRGAQVIIRMRGLPYNASPKEVVSCNL